MKKVLVLGGVSYDTIIYLNEFPEQKPMTIYSKGSNETVGSTGTGKALALKKLGFDVTLHGLIGDDPYGKKIKETLENENILFKYDIDDKGTERHVNLMNQHGGRISIYTNSSTFNPIIDYQLLEKDIQNSDLIVLNIINYCRNYIPIIKEHQKEIWCDIHDFDGQNPYHQDFIDAADYVFMSSDCLEDYEDYMNVLINQGKKCVICTHGKDGVSALTNTGEYFELPILDQYERVDTNGAGDNFFSGFLYGHTKGYDVETCLQLGTITAGLCITSTELVSNELSEPLLIREYNQYYL